MEQSYDQHKGNWKRNIVLFLGSQTISLFGSALVQFAIMWYITRETQSGIMMMLYILCGFVPTFLLSPFAGVWADRFNRKLLIAGADMMIAIATLALALLFLNGYGAMWLFFVVAAIRAIGTGIQMPAVGAILPQIVPADQLTRVNGINGSIQALVNLGAPMVSAAMLSTTAIEMIFFVDVITAVLAVSILLFLLRIPAHAKAMAQQTEGYFKDLSLGIAYIRKHDFLKPFFIFMAIFMIMVAPAAFLTPLQVTRSFGGEYWQLTSIEVAFSIGMIVGGGLIAAWGGFRNKTYTIILGVFLFGTCTILLGVVPFFWLYVLVMAITGIAMPIFNTPANVMLQEKVEESYLGRVFGVMSMITTSMMPLGMLIFGPIADFVEIEWLLIGTGIAMCLAGFILTRSKKLIEVGKPPVLEEA